MNDLVHYAAGLLVAGAWGMTGRRRFALGLFAVAPDWDVLTTPLVPYLITGLGLDHAQGHALVIALGHGAFSHSLFATAALVGIAYASGLRGRSLWAAACAVASHYPLDFVLTWSVWPFLPFSNAGLAWGVVTSTDLVVSAFAGLLLLALLVVDLRAWRARRAGRREPRPLPAWASLAAAALLAAVVAAPALMQQSLLHEHTPEVDVVADPVSYTRHALIAVRPDEYQMTLAGVGEGRLGELTVPRERDETGGAGRSALDIARRALEDADAPSPLVRPAFVARAGDTPGAIVVEAREASTLLAARFLGHDEVGVDLHFNAEGAVEAIHARKGGSSARIPVESLPLWVETAG